MPEAPILRYPHPLLKQRCRELSPADEPELVARAAADLVDTMRGQPRCVGLAAPQIGDALRLVAVDCTGHPKAESCHGLLVLVNPVIVRAEGDELGREGCLSHPRPDRERAPRDASSRSRRSRRRASRSRSSRTRSRRA